MPAPKPGKESDMEAVIQQGKPVARGKNERLGFRLTSRKKNIVEERAEALGITASELMTRYMELGMMIDKYFDPGESQLVIMDPRNWKRGDEVAIPYEQIIGDE